MKSEAVMPTLREFFSTTDYATVSFLSDSTGAVSQIDWEPATWATGDEHLRFPKIRARR